MKRPKLAFIDHSFHQKTNASSFLVEILKNEYEVELFWDESWNKGARVDLKKIAADGFNPIIFFQIFQYPEEEIKFLRDKNVILFPMFDASPCSSDHFWKNYANIAGVKFINFSKALHRRFTKFGFKSRYFQYFISPDHLPQSEINGGELKGFFWQRTDRITWNHIRALIKNTNFKNMNIHTAVDPPGCRVVLPTEKEIKKYNIKITKWFPDKEDYLQALRETDVFFAPRAAEGIGMSFLEAMAMGKCVAAPDNPTMNEYIRHGVSGLLYQPHRPRPLDFSGVQKICTNVRSFVEEGYKKWLQSQEELLDFIRESSDKKNIEKPLMQKKSTILYFQYRLICYKLKTFVRKCFPGLAKVLSGIKKICRYDRIF